MKETIFNILLPFAILIYPFELLYSQNIDTLSYHLGNEIQVSEPDNGGDLQCEPSVAINKNVILVSWNDSYGGKLNSKTGPAVGWSISYDNGKTFNFGGYLPESDNNLNLRIDGADSWVGTDSSGNFYLQVLSWQDSLHYIFVYYMDGKSLGNWQKRYIAYSDKGIDKPAMDVTPTGQINMVYTSIKNKTNEIFFIYSMNKGKEWQMPVKLSNSTNGIKTGSSVISCGNKVLVAWVEGTSMSQDEIWYAYSLDNGISFSKANLLYKLKKTFESAKGYTVGALKDKDPDATFLFSTSTWLTCTRKNDNEVVFYIANTEGTQKNGSRIILFKIKNNFKQISGPLEVGNNRKDYERIFPTMTKIKNKPVVFYYDRRDNPFTTITDVYLSIMLADNFYQDVKINCISSDWSHLSGDPKYAPIQRNIGDYMTIASYSNKLAMSWVGEKNGKSRIYFRLIEF